MIIMLKIERYFFNSLNMEKKCKNFEKPKKSKRVGFLDFELKFERNFWFLRNYGSCISRQRVLRNRAIFIDYNYDILSMDSTDTNQTH